MKGFAHDLKALYEKTGMKPADAAALRPALVLSDGAVRREVDRGNLEVLVVIGFAVNPTKFASHVEVFQHPAEPRVYRYRVKSSGNVYTLSASDVFKTAMWMLLKKGRKAEVFAPA